MQKYQNRFNKTKKIVIWMSEGSLPGGSKLPSGSSRSLQIITLSLGAAINALAILLGVRRYSKLTG